MDERSTFASFNERGCGAGKHEKRIMRKLILNKYGCYTGFCILASAILLTACASDVKVPPQALSEPANTSSEPHQDISSEAAQDVLSETTQASSSDSRELTIETATLTNEPGFIDWEEDGTPMQVIALKSEDGSVRLAFNTCQSCKGSPWAWFEYLDNGMLQCQNCKQQFSTEFIGTAKAAGCSPIMISDFSEGEGTVTISKKVLAEAVPWFANWKRTEE